MTNFNLHFYVINHLIQRLNKANKES
jgi:hypothetical protein